MEGVGRAVLLAFRTSVNGNVTASNGLVGLRHTEFADGDGSRDGHHRSCHQVLSGNAQPDVCAKDGSSDGGESYMWEIRQLGPSCGYENHAVEEVNEGVGGQGNEKERHME